MIQIHFLNYLLIDETFGRFLQIFQHDCRDFFRIQTYRFPFHIHFAIENGKKSASFLISLSFRPITRFISKMVFFGLIVCWTTADLPTTRPFSVKAMQDGVVVSLFLLRTIKTSLFRHMATHELVVPRSIPITGVSAILT